MSERRWDIVLRIASGPLASREPATYQGPTVSVGTAPRGAGVVLPGGRGIAPEHCTLSAYDPNTVFVTPSGHNPVRIAPYDDVRWEDLEPITGRTRLERGNAIHLGPTGQRGVTLVFVGCSDLGTKRVDHMVSFVERPPDGIRARGSRLEVRQVLTDTLDPSSFRLLVTALLGGAGVLTMVALALVVRLWSTRLEDHGNPNLDVPDLTTINLDEQLTVDFGENDPLVEFFIGPNNHLAGGDLGGQLGDDPKAWDGRFFQAVIQSARYFHETGCYYKRLEQVKTEYATVLKTLRDAPPICIKAPGSTTCRATERMPDVFAAIPMQESQYKPNEESMCCAKGLWQFMPEFGPRLSKRDPAFAVSGCHFEGAGAGASTWTPTQDAPPPRACDATHPTAAYIRPGVDQPQCRLGDCDVDFRTDPALSTRAAMIALSEPLQDPVLQASGAAVQIAIASHNAGYDDSRFLSAKKPFNLLPSYEAWAEDHPGAPTSHYMGDVIRCFGKQTTDNCERYMKKETQEYVFRIAAIHLLAVCYYGQNYSSDPVFAPWAAYAEQGGFCRQLAARRGVPSPREAASQCRASR